MKKAIIIATLMTALSASPALSDKRIVGSVQRIHDGDTFTLAGRQIRLWGVDAPELRQQCRDRHGQRYACGIEAKSKLTKIVVGKTVACRQRGVSGNRIVAECLIKGDDIGGTMVRSGYALDAAKYSNRTYAADQSKAIKAEVGLWRGSFQEPWMWRKANPKN